MASMMIIIASSLCSSSFGNNRMHAAQMHKICVIILMEHADTHVYWKHAENQETWVKPRPRTRTANVLLHSLKKKSEKKT